MEMTTVGLRPHMSDKLAYDRFNHPVCLYPPQDGNLNYGLKYPNGFRTTNPNYTKCADFYVHPTHNDQRPNGYNYPMNPYYIPNPDLKKYPNETMVGIPNKYTGYDYDRCKNCIAPFMPNTQTTASGPHTGYRISDDQLYGRYGSIPTNNYDKNAGPQFYRDPIGYGNGHVTSADADALKRFQPNYPPITTTNHSTMAPYNQRTDFHHNPYNNNYDNPTDVGYYGHLANGPTDNSLTTLNSHCNKMAPNVNVADIQPTQVDNIVQRDVDPPYEYYILSDPPTFDSRVGTVNSLESSNDSDVNEDVDVTTVPKNDSMNGIETDVTSSSIEESDKVDKPANEETPKFDKIPDWIVRWRKKEFKPKMCGVCKNLSRSSHFGGICCDSCKAFFRRAVRSKTYKKFACIHNKDCDVTGERRKLCQACRFQKCVSIGMEVKWVSVSVSEADQSKKQQQQQSSSSESNVAVTTNESRLITIVRFNVAITEEEKSSIGQLFDSYSSAKKLVVIPQSATLEMSLQTFHKILERFVLLVSTTWLVHDYDWQVMVRFSWIGVFVLRLVHVFDADKDCFPHCRLHLNAAIKDVDVNAERILSDGVLRKIFLLTRRMHDSRVDDRTTILLSLIHMMSHQNDSCNFRNAEAVSKILEQLLELLRKYLSETYGATVANHLYPLLISRLADFREIQDYIMDRINIIL